MIDIHLETSDGKRGVSPVIGVILMVAITVIMAAVIGTFVLDIGGNLSNSSTTNASILKEKTDTGYNFRLQSKGENIKEIRIKADGNQVGTLTNIGGKISVTVPENTDIAIIQVTREGTKQTINTLTVENSSANYISNTAPTDLAEIHNNMSGSGTTSDPYVITNVRELQAVKHESNVDYKLGNDIDATGTSSWNNGKGFKPIVYFSGTFNGNGHTINGLTVNRPESDAGLFVQSVGSIKNTHITNVNITGNSYVGGLAGTNTGTITNSTVTGSITSKSEYSARTGGLVGRNAGTIKNSGSSANITGNSSRVGGLVGYNNRGGTIKKSYATGDVNINSGDNINGHRVGGLVGENDGTNTLSTISNSYATGNVTSNGNNIGGLVGLNNSATVEKSYSVGNVTGGSNVGGFIGYTLSGTVSGSYWNTETTTQTNAIGKGSGTVTGLKTDEMQGSNAETNMASSNGGSLDFGTVWTTSSGEYPQLQWETET